MTFKKNNWKQIRLSDVCEKTISIDYRKQSGSFNYVDIGSINSELHRINEIQKTDWKNASSRARHVIYKNDTLFSTVRVNLKRVALVDGEIENGIASTGFTVLRAKKNMIDPLYLFYNSISPKFLEKLVHLQVGTAYPAVTDKIVFNQEIPLPPLPEQTQIAELFQSIETAIEQADKQEKNIKSVQNSLSNGLVSEEPVFGNLFNKKNCIPINFGGVADSIEQHDKQKKGVSRFIGLENIEPENLKITTWGNIFDGTTFTKRFSKGDVLFGKRRAYLKKVAVAEFDGICSSDILVFRAKAKMMLPGLLPYYASVEFQFYSPYSFRFIPHFFPC
jgi:type I restriction enzyme S subunit